MLGWVRGHIASKPWRFAAAGSVVLLAMVLLAWQAGFDRAAMAAAWEEVEAFLQARPWALFIALAVLPGLPFPVSALLLAAGVAWSDHPVLACAVCLGALAINICWTYWVAAYPGRKLVECLIHWSGLKIPEVPRGDQLGLILVMRLTPGIPLFFQNYVLGFVRAPFRLYLPLSILINGVHACGFVLVGAGVSGGKLLPVASGVGLVVAAVIVTRWLRARVVAKRETRTEAKRR
jgi:uncharacterized membrane protein YdjX (TVP38/TMEM64 family)